MYIYISVLTKSLFSKSGTITISVFSFSCLTLAPTWSFGSTLQSMMCHTGLSSWNNLQKHYSIKLPWVVTGETKTSKKDGKRERTYGCLHSCGHCTVSAYLQVEISVIELIIALGSEHTNLTYFKNMTSVWWGKEEKDPDVCNFSYLGLSWLICKITYGAISILMSMIPEQT